MLEQAKLQRQGPVDPHVSQMRKSRPRERGVLLKMELASQVEPEITLGFPNSSRWMKVFYTAQRLLMIFRLEIQQDTKHKRDSLDLRTLILDKLNFCLLKDMKETLVIELEFKKMDMFSWRVS